MPDATNHDQPATSSDGGTAGAPEDSRRRVAHLVLTGGPGAGKTSALAYLTEHLTARGWRVLTVPETATILITGGINDIGLLAATNRTCYLDVQHELVTLQRQLRDRFDKLAHALTSTGAAEKVVVLHDRGVADDAAYMTEAEYRAVLARGDLTPATAYDLYDAVIHLRSAAVTRPGYDGGAYTTENNAARHEDAAAAAHLDETTLAGWAGHAHLTVIGSAASFAEKLDRTLAAALHALGDPEPVEAERKFALTMPPDLSHPALATAVAVDIEQIYLPAGNGPGEQRVRARTLAGVTAYTHATKVDVGDDTRIEVETAIEEQTYRMLATLRDPATEVIHKTRYIFVVGDQRFELDHIHAPREAWLLEAEVVSLDDPIELPDFLPACTEVTHDRAWRNRALAASAAS